ECHAVPYAWISGGKAGQRITGAEADDAHAIGTNPTPMREGLESLYNCIAIARGKIVIDQCRRGNIHHHQPSMGKCLRKVDELRVGSAITHTRDDHHSLARSWNRRGRSRLID